MLDNNNEIWKDCKGYEGLYQVSSFGRIWSIRSQRYLQGSPDKDGYKRVNLTAKNGKVKTEKVHRLVGLAFLNNPNHYPVINHKDENKTNNKVDNLEWCSSSYNTQYSLSKKIKCIELDKIFQSSQQAMRELGVDGSDIRKCCKNSKKTAGGYHWCYWSEINDNT